VSSKYETILVRTPSNLNVGRSSNVARLVKVADDFAAVRKQIDGDTSLSAKGRNDKTAAYALQHVAPEVTRQRRLAAWQRNRIDSDKAKLAKEVRGEHDPLDAERRMVLRSMSDGQRAKAILEDPQARLAAIRGDTLLSGVPSDVLARAADIEINARFPDRVAQLAKDAEALEWHGAALSMLEGDLYRTPVNGGEGFRSDMEYNRFLEKLPAPSEHQTSREIQQLVATE
jgi:hypothetical protein